MKVTKVKGFETGDDKLSISLNPYILSYELGTQERIFRMLTSDEDTCISAQWYNYCEMTQLVPSSASGSFMQQIKSDQELPFSELDYYDPVQFKIIIDTRAETNAHLSSKEGKGKLLASRMKTTRP
jgi:hypothetical protein